MLPEIIWVFGFAAFFVVSYLYGRSQNIALAIVMPFLGIFELMSGMWLSDKYVPKNHASYTPDPQAVLFIVLFILIAVGGVAVGVAGAGNTKQAN